MSETVRLKASDGYELDAYVARPSGTAIAGLVVIQEAFGVNHHMRNVTRCKSRLRPPATQQKTITLTITVQ